MPYPGLLSFSRDEIENYIYTVSDMCRTLANVGLPERRRQAKGWVDMPEHEILFEKTAADLAYLRLCEADVRNEVKAVLAQLKQLPQDQALIDRRKALNNQISVILSNSERVFVEMAEFVFNTYIQPPPGETRTAPSHPYNEIKRLIVGGEGEGPKDVGPLKINAVTGLLESRDGSFNALQKLIGKWLDENGLQQRNKRHLNLSDEDLAETVNLRRPDGWLSP